MSYSWNDQLTIDTRTSVATLDANLQLLNNLTFQNEDTNIVLNATRVMNTYIPSSQLIMNSNYDTTPLYILPGNFSDSIQNDIYQVFNPTSNINSNVYLPGVETSLTIQPYSSIQYRYSFMWNPPSIYLLEMVSLLPSLPNVKNKIIKHISKLYEGNYYEYYIGSSTTNPSTVETSTFVFTKNKQPSYFRLLANGQPCSSGFVDVVADSGTNVTLAGWYAEDTKQIQLAKVSSFSNVASNISMLHSTETILPNTVGQSNTFMINLDMTVPCVNWVRIFSGIQNIGDEYIQPRITLSEDRYLTYSTYVRTENITAKITAWNSNVSQQYDILQEIQGTTLNNTNELIITRFQLNGSLTNFSRVIPESLSVPFIRTNNISFHISFYPFIHLQSCSDGNTVLYLRNNTNTSYRIYSQTNTLKTKIATKNILLRFDNQLQLVWSVNIESINHTIPSPIDTIQNDKTLVMIHSPSSNIALYNHDGSLYNYIGLDYSKTLIGYVIYDNVGNIVNFSYTECSSNISNKDIYNIHTIKDTSFVRYSYTDVVSSNLYIDSFESHTSQPISQAGSYRDIFTYDDRITHRYFRIGNTVEEVTLNTQKLQVFDNLIVGSDYYGKIIPKNDMIIYGNVGIGTTYPLERLYVHGNIVATGSLITSNLIVQGDTTILNTVTSNSEQMIINNTGTGPALKVLQGGAQPVAEFYDVESGLSMCITNTGLIGINSSSPMNRLDVGGNTYLNGTLLVNGTITTNNNTINAGSGAIYASNFYGTATQVSQPLIRGSYLTGYNYNGSETTIWTVDADSNAKPNKVVVRDIYGSIYATNVGISTTVTRKTLDINGDAIVSGNLGIGTTLPILPFHVSGQSYLSGNLGIGTTLPRKLVDIQGGDAIVSGNIGIGTTIPRKLLDVQGGDAIISGNLGIGTSFPVQSFHVAGQSYLSGNLGIGTTLPRTLVDIQGGDTIISGNLGIGTTIPQAFLHLPAGTTTVAPVLFTTGATLTNSNIGALEFDGNGIYLTDNLISGRAEIPRLYTYRLLSDRTNIGSAIADYFPYGSSINVEGNSYYDIEAYCYFLKNTLGTITWTWTFTSSVALARSYYTANAVAGFTTSVSTTAPITGIAVQQTTSSLAHAATASLANATYHDYHFRLRVITSTQCNIRLQITNSAGTVTPKAGSYYTVKKIDVTTGSFAP